MAPCIAERITPACGLRQPTVVVTSRAWARNGWTIRVATCGASMPEFSGVVQNALDQRARIDAIGNRREIQYQPVVQRRDRDLVDVIVRDVHAAIEQCAHLGAQQERLPAAGTRTETDVAGDLLVGRQRGGSARR